MFLAWKVDSRLEDDLVFAAPSLWAAVMVEETTVGILVAAEAVVLEADCDTKNICFYNLLKLYRYIPWCHCCRLLFRLCCSPPPRRKSAPRRQN